MPSTPTKYGHQKPTTPTNVNWLPNIGWRCFVARQFLSFLQTFYKPKNVVVYQKLQISDMARTGVGGHANADKSLQGGGMHFGLKTIICETLFLSCTFCRLPDDIAHLSTVNPSPPSTPSLSPPSPPAPCLVPLLFDASHLLPFPPTIKISLCSTLQKRSPKHCSAIFHLNSPSKRGGAASIWRGGTSDDNFMR